MKSQPLKDSELPSSIMTVHVINGAITDKIDDIMRMIYNTPIDPETNYQIQMLMADLGPKLDGLKQFVKEIDKWTNRIKIETEKLNNIKSISLRHNNSSTTYTDTIKTFNMINEPNDRTTHRNNNTMNFYNNRQITEINSQDENEDHINTWPLDQEVEIQGNCFTNKTLPKSINMVNDHSSKPPLKVVKYPSDFKAMIVKQAKSGKPISKITEEFKVSRTTVRRWLNGRKKNKKAKNKVTSSSSSHKIESKILSYLSKELETTRTNINKELLIKEISRLIEPVNSSAKGSSSKNMSIS